MRDGRLKMSRSVKIGAVGSEVCAISYFSKNPTLEMITNIQTADLVLIVYDTIHSLQVISSIKEVYKYNKKISLIIKDDFEKTQQRLINLFGEMEDIPFIDYIDYNELSSSLRANIDLLKSPDHE